MEWMHLSKVMSWTIFWWLVQGFGWTQLSTHIVCVCVCVCLCVYFEVESKRVMSDNDNESDDESERFHALFTGCEKEDYFQIVRYFRFFYVNLDYPTIHELELNLMRYGKKHVCFVLSIPLILSLWKLFVWYRNSAFVTCLFFFAIGNFVLSLLQESALWTLYLHRE